MRAEDDRKRLRRIGWFIALWIAGFASVSVIAFVLKLIMTAITPS